MEVPQHHIVIRHVLDHLRTKHQVKLPPQLLGDGTSKVLLPKLNRDSGVMDRNIPGNVQPVQLVERETPRYDR
jgi:hypothetical protein